VARNVERHGASTIGRIDVAVFDTPIDSVTVPRRCRTRTTIAIHGFGSSGGGSLSLEHALWRVNGVTRVSVNAVTEMAYVEHCPFACSVEDLLITVRQTGFHGHEHDPHYHG
jgi:hypothetical protein